VPTILGFSLRNPVEFMRSRSMPTIFGRDSCGFYSFVPAGTSGDRARGVLIQCTRNYEASVACLFLTPFNTLGSTHLRLALIRPSGTFSHKEKEPTILDKRAPPLQTGGTNLRSSFDALLFIQLSLLTLLGFTEVIWVSGPKLVIPFTQRMRGSPVKILMHA
jgi:hypothetical protein